MKGFFKDYSPYIIGAIMAGAAIAGSMSVIRETKAQAENNTGAIRNLERTVDKQGVEYNNIKEQLNKMDTKLDKLLFKESRNGSILNRR